MLRKFIYSEKAENLYFDAIKKPNADTAILFLHGLGGSRRSWGDHYNSLSKHASLYFIDLLGYGFSAKPSIEYTLDNHISALKKFIEKEVKEKYIILVGHSLGAIIALGFTSLYPEKIKKTILLSLPYYNSPEEAYKYVSKSSRFTFIFKYNLQTKILCTVICSFFGPITRQISPLFIRNIPRPVAQDVHRHSYQSYISTLTNVLYNQNLPKLFKPLINCKLILIHGTSDSIVPIKNINKLTSIYNLSLLVKSNADHRFPLFESSYIINILEKELN